MRALFAAALAAVALPAWSQTPAATAKEAASSPAAAAAKANDAAPPPAPAAAKEATPPPPGEGGRPYVDAALTFLKSFTHTNRAGDAGAQAWTALRAVSADKVAIKVGGKDLVLDAAGGKTEAQLVRFAKLSTWRDGNTVKGVTLDEAEFRVGSEPQKGKAKLAMSEKEGKWVVDSIEVE